MQRPSIRWLVAASTIVLAAWTGSAGRIQDQQTPPGTTASATKELPTQEVNDDFVQRLSKQIAGHEQEPAGQVFKNIQLDIFKKTPASRLLLIMNLGYSRALGVTYRHCHVEDDFSKDDKRPKRAAREVALMHFSINQQLAKMENLEPNPQGHFVNRSTCHRGSIKPREQTATSAPVEENLTARNKAIVRDFYTTVLIGREVDAAPRFLRPDYIQHNPQVPTGLKGFMDTFRERFAQKLPPDYKRELLNVIGEGDMVIIYVRQTWTGRDGQHHQALEFDMFRVQDGKIAEHWDAD